MIGAHIVGGFGKESVWGTPVAATTTLLLHGSGIQARERNTTVAVDANSHYPARRSNELVGLDLGLTIPQLLYIDSVQALLEMATKRTAGVLDSYTIYRKLGSIETRQYAGCKVNQLTLRADPSGLVEAMFDIVAKAVSTAGSFTPATYPTGMPYKGARVAISVDGVVPTAFRNLELTCANNLIVGPSGTDFSIQDLDEGFQIWGGTLTAKFVSAAWNALRSTLVNNDLDTFPVIVTFQNNTGATAKNLVISFPTARAVGAPIEGDQGTTLTQQIEIVTEDALPTITYPS